MRNYLQFQDNLTNNSINKLYFDLKNNFTNHNNLLEQYKKSLLNEEKYFIVLSDKINSDFSNFNNSDTELDNNKLIKEYINIINQSDNIYNKKINSINENINKHFISNKNNIFKLKVIYSYLKNLFYLKNHIYKIINLPFKKFKIDKFKKNINKIIHYKNLLDNNFKSSFYNKKNDNQNNITKYQKKINNISNIIDKNDLVLSNLLSNIKNTKNEKEKHYLTILYDNSNNNKKMFGGKLKHYFTKLNNITNSIDKKVNNNTNNINSLKYTELLETIKNIEQKSYKKNINYIVNLLISLIFNKKYIKINKIKNLLHQYSNLSY